MLLKRAAMDAMLEDGPVLVAVDTAFPGVEVPGYLRTSDCVLRFGYQLSPPITDLNLDAETLVGTLYFKGSWFRCELPWGAIFSMKVETSAHIINWPRETAFEIEVEAPARRHLKLVD